MLKNINTHGSLLGFHTNGKGMVMVSYGGPVVSGRFPVEF